MQDSK